MHMQKYNIIFIFIFLFFLLTCRYDRIYNNKGYRYNIKYPVGWIALYSGHDKEAEKKFLIRLDEESSITNYSSKDVDVAFYNPNSSGPIFQHIAVKSTQQRYNINNLQTYLPQLEQLFANELMMKYSNVKKLKSDIQGFKRRSKILVFEFSFDYEGNRYFATYRIVPGKLFATHFFSSICLNKDKENFIPVLNKVLNSFDKY